NTLVLRTDLAGNPTFQQLLMRVREIALGAYAHQHIPFESLVEALQPERDMSRSSLFQVLFVHQNTQAPSLDLSELTIRSLNLDIETAKFDLALFVAEIPQGLQIEMEYNTDLFETSTIERMLTHYRLLLEEFIENPERQIARVSLTSEQEKYQILHVWNATDMLIPQDKCIHQ